MNVKEMKINIPNEMKEWKYQDTFYKGYWKYWNGEYNQCDQWETIADFYNGEMTLFLIPYYSHSSEYVFTLLNGMKKRKHRY
jgi:hypothetical protein